MKNNRRELPKDIELSNITFEDIRWRYGVFYCDSIGSGRNKKRIPWHGVKTRLGELEEDDWIRLAEAVIDRAGESDLLQQMILWCSEHNYTRMSREEIRKEALQLHTAKIFDNPKWVSFIPFNTKYRPGVLETAHIVRVCMDCCPEPGLVTQEQIDACRDGQIACPHCGRWSTFTLLEG